MAIHERLAAVNGHIDRWLLAAYVEGQLSPERSRHVRAHVAGCPSCYEKLVQHERLSTDLRLALTCIPAPPKPKVQHWWRAIRTPAPIAASVGVVQSLFPVLLSLVLLALPLTTDVGSGVVVSVAPIPIAPGYGAESVRIGTTPQAPVVAASAAVPDATPEPSVMPDPVVIAPAMPPTP